MPLQPLFLHFWMHFWNPNSHYLKNGKPSPPDLITRLLCYKGAKPSWHSPVQGLSWGGAGRRQPFLHTWTLVVCGKQQSSSLWLLQGLLLQSLEHGVTEKYSSNNYFVAQTQMISSLGFMQSAPSILKAFNVVLSVFYGQEWIKQNTERSEWGQSIRCRNRSHCKAS